MSRKRYYIAGIILTIIAIALIAAGVLLFMHSPSPNASGYYDTKGALYMTGVVFSFMFGAISACIGVGILLEGILKD